MIIGGVLLSSCCRKPAKSSFEKDSIREVIRTEYKEIIRDTVIYVPLPIESKERLGIPGDSSHLETSLASSTAWISPDGRLNHSLQNKEATLPAKAQIKDSHRVDTVIREQTHYVHDIEIHTVRHIPKFFWICFAITLLSCGYIVIKITRIFRP